MVRDYPEKEELNYYLADALTQAGEIGKAIEAYDALESVMGMNEAISMQKYKLYVQLEKPEEAFKEIEKLAAKYPMEARYQIVLGDLHLENGEMDKALACYQKANEIDPTDPYYIVSMANYYEAKGDKEAAEQQIRSALVNEKLDVETKVNILSRYILKLQQTKQGTENANHLFQTLLEQHPEDIDLKLMYGGLLMAQGKTEEAKFQFQLVTEMEPGNAGAWQQLLNLALKGVGYPGGHPYLYGLYGAFPRVAGILLLSGYRLLPTTEISRSLEYLLCGLEYHSEGEPAAEIGFLRSDR